MQGGGHIVVSLVISEITEVEILLFKCISFSENQQAPLTPPLPTNTHSYNSAPYAHDKCIKIVPKR